MLRPEHVSDAEIGAGRKSSEREWSSERTWQNTVEREGAE